MKNLIYKLCFFLLLFSWPTNIARAEQTPAATPEDAMTQMAEPISTIGYWSTALAEYPFPSVYIKDAFNFIITATTPTQRTEVHCRVEDNRGLVYHDGPILLNEVKFFNLALADNYYEPSYTLRAICEGGTDVSTTIVLGSEYVWLLEEAPGLDQDLDGDGIPLGPDLCPTQYGNNPSGCPDAIDANDPEPYPCADPNGPGCYPLQQESTGYWIQNVNHFEPGNHVPNAFILHLSTVGPIFQDYDECEVTDSLGRQLAGGTMWLDEDHNFSLDVPTDYTQMTYSIRAQCAGGVDTTVSVHIWDADADGVFGSADLCPGIYGVYPTGCPETFAETIPEPPLTTTGSFMSLLAHYRPGIQLSNAVQFTVSNTSGSQVTSVECEVVDSLGQPLFSGPLHFHDTLYLDVNIPQDYAQPDYRMHARCEGGTEIETIFHPDPEPAATQAALDAYLPLIAEPSNIDCAIDTTNPECAHVNDPDGDLIFGSADLCPTIYGANASGCPETAEQQPNLCADPYGPACENTPTTTGRLTSLTGLLVPGTYYEHGAEFTVHATSPSQSNTVECEVLDSAGNQLFSGTLEIDHTLSLNYFVPNNYFHPDFRIHARCAGGADVELLTPIQPDEHDVLEALEIFNEANATPVIVPLDCAADPMQAECMPVMNPDMDGDGIEDANDQCISVHGAGSPDGCPAMPYAEPIIP